MMFFRPAGWLNSAELDEQALVRTVRTGKYKQFCEK
jgi:hypothetical protein